MRGVTGHRRGPRGRCRTVRWASRRCQAGRGLVARGGRRFAL